MKKVKGLGFLAFILCLSLVLPSLVFDVSAATTGFLNLNKLMDTSSTSSGSFTLTADSRFFIVSKAEPAENLVEVVQLASGQFAEDSTPTSQTLPIVYGTELFSQDGDILIVINDTYAPDAYRISVDSKIKITASNDRGVLYGLNTLLKYFRAEKGNTVPCFTVSNTPDVKERIFMLDCARKYFTKDWICNLIRELSWMGYNTLELHFTEDGGMRLDIWDPAYFTSANDFTWVLGGNGAYWVDNADRDDENADRYLTAAELVEILNVAKQYRIDVIPAFDTPWHSEYMCKKYEAYATATATRNNTFSYNGKTYTYKDVPQIHFCLDTTYSNRHNGINVTNDQARAFVYAIMSDYADFFKQYAGSTDFNIGADEVLLTRAEGWDTFASSKGIGSTAYDTFIWFVNNVYDLLAGKGYNVRAYNDFLERGDKTYTQQLNENLEIVYWNSDNPSYPPNNSAGYNMKPAAEFIKDGRTVYTGIATYCYYVLRTVDANDARDPAFNNFQFNKATAENIWTYWEPTLVSAADACDETNWVVTIDISPQIHLSADQVEGAYYMFWGDEAGISTEEEIWNGVDANGKWNIRERMWANINKMWKINADGSSLSHDSVQTLRTAVGDFPGLTTCSAETVLPAAQTLALAPPPAEPSGNGSISISNAIDGQVYSAYRILDLESYDKTTGIYRYNVSERWASFFESGAPGLNYMTVSEGGSVSWNSGADPAAFAKAAKAFADENGIPPNAVAEAMGDPAQAYIGNVPLGYYLVDTSIGSLCSLDTTDNDAVVSEKNTEPEIDKKLKDKAEDEYTDNANSASIGDTVYYQLEITVGRGAINYVVEDTFDNGLTFDAEQSVEVVGANVGANAGTDYTLTVDGQTFKIEFNNDYLDHLETKAEDPVIVIRYQATVNKDALIRTANQNKVMLRWGNGTRCDTDHVETFVYDFSYTKVDGAGNPLNGAKFKLYDAEKEGDKIPVEYVGTKEIDGTSYNVYRKALAGEGVDMNGTHVIVEGFDAEDSGKLYLHETKSPEGYNILTGRVAVNLSTENRLDMEIENRSGQELPSTGGFGTAAFIFVGSLLMLAAMVLFSTEKKMSVR